MLPKVQPNILYNWPEIRYLFLKLSIRAILIVVPVKLSLFDIGCCKLFEMEFEKPLRRVVFLD